MNASMHKVLVTGGAGFIGSNLIEFLLENTPDMIVNLDKLTYAADQQWARDFKHDRLEFVQGDICDAVFVQSFTKSQSRKFLPSP